METGEEMEGMHGREEDEDKACSECQNVWQGVVCRMVSLSICSDTVSGGPAKVVRSVVDVDAVDEEVPAVVAVLS